MNITVKTRHMKSSDALTQYVQGKCEKLERYYDGIQSVEVILDHEADNATAEIVVTARKKHTFVANSSDPDMYACIDHCVDKISQQVRRFKDKVRKRQGQPHSQVLEEAMNHSEETEENS